MAASPYDDLTRPPLRADALRSALVAPAGPLARLEVLAEVGSTNETLGKAAADDPTAWPSRSVLTADSQVAGKGRVGRSWVAPPRSGLAVSLLVRPTADARWSWLPLLAGVATVSVVRDVAGLDAWVKWPNDVLVGGSKVAGILAEASSGAVVVGIGLNVTSTRAELPVASATSLVLEGATSTDRDTLLRALVRALCRELDSWEAAGGDAVASGLADRVRESCSTVGSTVVVDLPDGRRLEGVAEGIDDDGHLTVRIGESASAPGEAASGSGQSGTLLHTVVAGDVTHVRCLPSPQ